MNSLLRDPFFTVVMHGETRRVDLPTLLVRLAAGDVEQLLGVSEIQRQFLWRFVVRCAARVQARWGVALSDPEAVRERLAEETGGEEAWWLVRTDSGPAFLQPPVTCVDGRPEGFKQEDLARLSIVPGSKNHELKIGAGACLSPTETVMALLEYQLGSIFTKGNYASQIMGSATGKGSGVPFMAPWWDDLGATFRQHVAASVAETDEVRSVVGLTGDVWALWTQPWDGATSLPSMQLAPHFIPLARRIRLAPPNAQGMFATLFFAATTAPRVADHTQGGGLGDPFVPTILRDGRQKVRGVMGSGFDYREVARLLLRASGDAVGAPSTAVARAAASSSGDLVPVVMEGIAFDQGKTLGFHRRIVRMPGRVLLDPEPVLVLTERRLSLARDAERALGDAIRVWLAGSSRPRRGDRPRVDRLKVALTQQIDRLFVAELAALRPLTDAEVETRLQAWRNTLRAVAEAALELVMREAPTASTRMFERNVEARAALRSSLRRSGWNEQDMDSDVEPPVMETLHGI